MPVGASIQSFVDAMRPTAGGFLVLAVFAVQLMSVAGAGIARAILYLTLTKEVYLYSAKRRKSQCAVISSYKINVLSDVA